MLFNFFEDIPQEFRQSGVTGRTEIQTPHGSTRVEELEEGDVVLTNVGFRPILRVERTRVRSDMVAQPVRVADHPHSDDFGLQVAPYQIVSVQDWRLMEMFGVPEVGVEARFLIGWRGVQVTGHGPQVYFSLYFAAPMTVWAVGGLFACAGSTSGADNTILTTSQAREWRSWIGPVSGAGPNAPLRTAPAIYR
jgi:hypothetical protein